MEVLVNFSSSPVDVLSILSHFKTRSCHTTSVHSLTRSTINECGAWKVLWAAICAGFGKLVGKHGIFYDMVGMEVTGLDGFYPDVFPVYGDYGIRIPENPSGVCNEIFEKTGVRAMIVDANDLTRDILGKADCVTLTDEQLCEIIRDNPAGQDDQCTPFILIRKKQ